MSLKFTEEFTKTWPPVINQIAVHDGRKLIGYIKPVQGGWFYLPKGSKHGGKVWKLLRMVKLDVAGLKGAAEGK